MNYIVLPLLSSGDPNATYMINKWYVMVGSKVKVGDALAACEMDKSVVDICSDYDGIVAEIYVQSEEVVAPGTKICAIE